MWTTRGRKASFQQFHLDDLGLGLDFLSSSFPHKKRDAGPALQTWPGCEALSLIPNYRSAKSAGGAEGKDDRTIYLSRKPRGQNRPRIGRGNWAARDGIAGGEPTPQATRNQGFKTFADINLDFSK